VPFAGAKLPPMHLEFVILHLNNHANGDDHPMNVPADSTGKKGLNVHGDLLNSSKRGCHSQSKRYSQGPTGFWPSDVRTIDARSRGSVRLPCALRAAVGGSRWSHRVMLGTASERQSHPDLGGIPLRYPKVLSSAGVSRVCDITVR